MASSESGLKLTDLPYDCLYQIFGYISYHEVAFCRLICRSANAVCHSVLSSGAEHLRMKLNWIQFKLKAQLPRRESARRGHMASDLLEVVNSVENRVSIIRLALDRYLMTGQLTFFPGKVLDEAFRIIRVVEGLAAPPSSGSPPQNPFTALQKVTMLRDLRDLSTMASEHIDDVILPSLRHRPPSVEPLFKRLTLIRPHELLPISPEKPSTSANFQSPVSLSSNGSGEGPSSNNDDPILRLCGLFFEQFRALSSQIEELKNQNKAGGNKITQLTNEVGQLKQQLSREQIFSASLAKKIEVAENAVVEMRRLAMNGSSIPQICDETSSKPAPKSRSNKRKMDAAEGSPKVAKSSRTTRATSK